MFARKDIERDALSDYRQYGRQARTHKDLPGGAPSVSSEWPRVFVPAEPAPQATPEPTPARAPPVEKIVLRGVPFRLSSHRSSARSSWASDVSGLSETTRASRYASMLSSDVTGATGSAGSNNRASRYVSVMGMNRITSQTILEIDEAQQVVLRQLTESELRGDLVVEE